MSHVNVLTGDRITAFTYFRLRACLKMEIIGMSVSRGPSAAKQIRELISSKTRDKSKLLREFNVWLFDHGWVGNDGHANPEISARVVKSIVTVVKGPDQSICSHAHLTTFGSDTSDTVRCERCGALFERVS